VPASPATPRTTADKAGDDERTALSGQGRDLVLIGASAGGVEALKRLVAALPPDLAACLLIVMHVGPASALPAILTRSGPLAAQHARDGERLRSGVILLAPPDRHLLVDDGIVRLDRGPRENGARPSIDALFRTAAHAHPERSIAVVLSGAGKDGALGLELLRRRGGIAVAQADPLFADMPLAAQRVGVDHLVPIADVGDLLVRLTGRGNRQGSLAPSTSPGDDRIELDDPGWREHASGLSCPDCGGALWQVGEGETVGFRCHVGHRYSLEALYDQHNEAAERALFAAVRALEERAEICRRLIERSSHGSRILEAWHAEAAAAEEQASLIRELIRGGAARVAADEP
jgi:two-component system chemotaxis response regulator CheB